MGGCQNYSPFLGTLHIGCRIIMGTQKGTIILTTTHINISKLHWSKPGALRQESARLLQILTRTITWDQGGLVSRFVVG